MIPEKGQHGIILKVKPLVGLTAREKGVEGGKKLHKLLFLCTETRLRC